MKIENLTEIIKYWRDDTQTVLTQIKLIEGEESGQKSFMIDRLQGKVEAYNSILMLIREINEGTEE